MTSMTAEQAQPGQSRPGAGRRRRCGGPTAPAVRVLVVDDEPSLAELLASVLRYEGWDIQDGRRRRRPRSARPASSGRTRWSWT